MSAEATGGRSTDGGATDAGGPALPPDGGARPEAGGAAGGGTAAAGDAGAPSLAGANSAGAAGEANPPACPFSDPLGRGCKPVCGSKFEIQGPAGELNSDDGDTIAGVSFNGDVLLVRSASFCAFDTLVLAKKTATGFDLVDLSADPDLADTYIVEASFAPSGERLLVPVAKRDALVSLKLSVEGVEAPDATDFEAINEWATGDVMLASPVISGDGLTLTFIAQISGVGWWLYEANRASAGQPFAEPHPLKADVDGLWSITALSWDGLVALGTKDLATYVFARADLTQEFAQQGPPLTNIWNVRIGGPCQELFGVTSVGGCQNQDITHVHAR